MPTEKQLLKTARLERTTASTYADRARKATKGGDLVLVEECKCLASLSLHQAEEAELLIRLQNELK